MSRTLIFGVTSCVAWAVAGHCAADALHVFGPEGTPSERRALVVVERADGRCASWEGLEVSSADAGVAAVLGAAIGECARWVTITAAPPRDRVELRARGDGVEASAGIAMGSEHGLRVRAHRRGELLMVEVDGAPEAEPVRVIATWGDQQRELASSGRAWRGEVPPAALVGVVARSGGLTGAAASVPEGLRGHSVLILPSDLAVHAGGAPRTAAFLLVTDERGRLSRNVPLRVTSERGRLRSMRWLEPGIAAVRLSVTTDVESVDLAVEIAQVRVARELAVASGWPSHASIDAPSEIATGAEIAVHISVRTTEGEPLDDDRLVIRCGGADAVMVAGSARCSPPASGTLTVVAAASIDGRAVPLASHSIQVRPAAEVSPAATAPPAAPPSTPEPVLAPGEEEPPLAIAGLLHAGVDTWARPSGGAGARIAGRIAGPLGAGAAVRYVATPFAAQSDDRRVPDVEGIRHAVEILAEASLRGRIEGIGLSGWVGAGVVWIEESASLGADAHAVAPVLAGAVGPSLVLDRSVAIDLCIGVRAVLDQPRAVWAEAPVRFFVEVGVVVLP